MLHHAVGVDAQTRLSLGLGLETRPDMHAARIEPCKERLLCTIGAIDEVERSLEELLIHIFHALLVERAGVLTVLLAPLSEARIFSGVLNGGRCASQHTARTKLEPELGTLRIIRVLR